MVDPVACAPQLRNIAQGGHRTHLAYLPLRCACTGSQIAELFSRVQSFLASEPQTAWILAGHSRGAMLATRIVHERNAPLAGLALIGTTHPRDFSLAGLTMPVLKVYGTRDGVASPGGMQRNRHLLPPHTRTNWATTAQQYPARTSRARSPPPCSPCCPR